VPTADLPLLQIAVVTATENGGGVLRQVQFQDAGYAAGQELPVMAHQHHTTPQVADEVLQSGQAVEVEIVRRLVE